MVSKTAEIEKQVDKIEGWLSHREGKLLYNLAKKCTNRGVIVEIGSWKGKSAIWLGKGSKAGNKTKIYAIDPYCISNTIWSFDEFRKNIKNAGIDDVVIPIVSTSEEAAKNFNKPVELIFIDGNHDYKMVKLDFKLWFPKVIDGGMFVFHDTIVWDGRWAGPKKLVKESVFKSKNFKDTRFTDSITFAKKTRNNSLSDRLRNRYVLLSKNLFEFTGRIIRKTVPKDLRKIARKL